VEHDGLVRLTWETKMDDSLASQDYYFCVFRKGKGDTDFRYQMNVDKDEVEYTDNQLRKGEEATYYVTIQFKDGRESHNSNTVNIKR
jgi:hypothetical protein